MQSSTTLAASRDSGFGTGRAVRGLLVGLTEHRSLMLGATAGIIAYAVAAGSPGATAQLAVLAAAVAVFGLPHGALDHLVGRQILAPIFGRRWGLVFFTAYLILAGLMGAVWFAAPVAALALFLLLSSLHFGWDDPLWVRCGERRWDALERSSVGALPIVLPAWIHSTEVTVIFGWMMPAGRTLDSGVIAALAGCFAAVVIPVSGLRFVRLLVGRSASQAAAAELGSIILLHVVAPPVIAFLTYFCGWHSIRHALELADGLAPGRLGEGLRRFAREALPLTLITVVAAITAAAVLLIADVQAEALLASVVFIGLSVLTVPHMAVMALGRRCAAERWGGPSNS